MKTAAFSATGDKTLLKIGGLDQIAANLLNRFSQNKAHYTQGIAVAGNVPRRRANATCHSTGSRRNAPEQQRHHQRPHTPFIPRMAVPHGSNNSLRTAITIRISPADSRREGTAIGGNDYEIM